MGVSDAVLNGEDMRNVKFRGLDLQNNWVFGSLVQTKEWETLIVTMSGRNMTSMDKVEAGSVGQFTGLTDKNGKEIFEGDIVECVSWNEFFSKDGMPTEAMRRKMYVDFRRGAFVMVEPMPEPLKDNEWDIIYNGDIEVIGNRHENPELLKAR